MRVRQTAAGSKFKFGLCRQHVQTPFRPSDRANLSENGEDDVGGMDGTTVEFSRDRYMYLSGLSIYRTHFFLSGLFLSFSFFFPIAISA